MAADQAILREYLVALGFQVDKAAQAKFGQGLTKLDKTAGLLGKTILGISAAATGMATVFAKEMEKMYYSSRRAGSTIANMGALEYGFGQIGLNGDKARAALENMGRALRSNPGLTGLLNSLGVQVTGRDKADVLMDLVTQLKKMPSHIAEQYANMFGIDPDTLFMLEDGLDKMKEASALRKQMAKDAGLDLDKMGEAGVKFSNSLKEAWERIGLIGARVSSEMLPPMQSFMDGMNNNLDSIGKWLGKFKTIGDALSSIWTEKNSRRHGKATSVWEMLTTHRVPDHVPLADGTLGPNAAAGAPQPAKGRSASGKITDASPTAAPASSMPASSDTREARLAKLSFLEKQYALPDGMLSRMWKQESNEGDPKFMRSSAGAKGHFQFMDPTAKQYGVTDPDDFDQSSKGAARMLSDLSRKYDGDARKMAAGYNWGQGNVDRYGLGAAPAETRDYMEKVAPQINQTNHISVTGVSDPQQAARAVTEQQKTVNADLVRNASRTR